MKKLKSVILYRIWCLLMYILPDKAYLKLKYLVIFRHRLNLDNPETLNEKIQWLKLYGFRPEYTMMADKFLVKDFVKETIGEQYVIPTLGVWDNPEDIDFDALPDRFVLKANHNSAGIYICKDKDAFDTDAVVDGLKKQLRSEYHLVGKENVYKGIKKKVLAEPYMEDEVTGELRDYKFFCFNGKVRAMFVATGRQKYEEPFFDFFDADYNHLDVRQHYRNALSIPAKPECFELMKILATKLSQDIPFVRVDFYEADARVYFGEMTFYHFSGFAPFDPPQWDKEFGSWLTLPEKR